MVLETILQIQCETVFSADQPHQRLRPDMPSPILSPRLRKNSREQDFPEIHPSASLRIAVLCTPDGSLIFENDLYGIRENIHGKGRTASDHL